MKKIILFLIFISTLGCTKIESGKTIYSTDAKKVFLVITENTTKDELIKISKEFKIVKNIDIDFSESTFYEGGKVKNVNLKVNCNDGYSGVAINFGTTFNINNCGFQRDYTENTEKPWSIGSM